MLQRLAQEGHGKCLHLFGGFEQRLIVNEFLCAVVCVSTALHAKDRRSRDKASGKGLVARI